MLEKLQRFQFTPVTPGLLLIHLYRGGWLLSLKGHGGLEIVMNGLGRWCWKRTPQMRIRVKYYIKKSFEEPYKLVQPEMDDEAPNKRCVNLFLTFVRRSK